ncbi:MAG: ABC transporter ATP-binding protein [Rhizobiaceae bacterium]|nr:ABC transporter ATP-binding protein [Rhizobiaceae bacterium]
MLHPTSFELQAGQVLGVVGPNGAGKSTLLRMIYRYQKPTTGNILVNGQDIWKMPAKSAARVVAAVLQEQPSSFGLTVREIIALGRTPHRSALALGGKRDSDIIESVIVRLGLENIANRNLSTLSGGERQRVMVARALVQEPQVLVLDEPTNHLDIRHQLEVLSLIRDLDLTIVVSLHDLNMAAQTCDAILLLKNGHPMSFGPPEQVLCEGLVSDVFRVQAHKEHLMPSQSKHFSFHLPQ